MTDPFRYTPDPLVIKAAREVADSISSNPMLEREFSKGKMIGVLIYRKHDDTIGHIAAFSGNVAGTNHIEGFVPPIYDLLDPDGYFKKEGEENDAVIAAINEAAPNILFVCLGVPAQEKWIDANRDRLPTVRAALGLGGSLDSYAGTMKRAPKIFIKLNLEWFYRLCCQPSRIGRMMKLPKFVFGTLLYRLTGKNKK